MCNGKDAANVNVTSSSMDSQDSVSASVERARMMDPGHPLYLRIVSSEYELSETLGTAQIDKLFGKQPWPPRGDRRAFLEEALSRFLEDLPARIEWWQRQAEWATRPRTVGRAVFDEYVKALGVVLDNRAYLEALPFEQRFTESALALTLSYELPLRLDADAPEAKSDDFFDDTEFAIDRLQHLLAVQEWGSESFLPDRQRARKPLETSERPAAPTGKDSNALDR